MRWIAVLLLVACGGEEAVRELIEPVDCFHWSHGALNEAPAWRDDLAATRCPSALGVAIERRDRSGGYLQILCCREPNGADDLCKPDTLDPDRLDGCCDPRRLLDECYSLDG